MKLKGIIKQLKIYFPSPIIRTIERMINYLKKINFTAKKTLKFHVIGWALFIFHDAFMGGLVKGSFGTFGNYLVHYIINICLFHFHSLVILPNSFRSKKKSIWIFPILLIIELLTYQSFTYGVDLLLLNYTNILDIKGLHFDKTFILAYTWRGLYIMMFSTGYYLFKRYKAERDEKEALEYAQFETQIRKEALEKRVAEAKTAFLLAQINPHFLFNTLNFIYYTTAKKSPEGAASIMLLSKIMRFSSDIENSRELILLGREAEYVEWLIEIHKMRFKENFYLTFNCTRAAKNWKIIPYLLITVAENMFKHGVTSDPENRAELSVYEDEMGYLKIISINKKKALRDERGLQSGLFNLQERMESQYGELARISYFNSSNDNFQLNITISSLG